MRLRARLALSGIAAALPLAAATVWARHDLTRRRVAQVLREFAVTRMESGGRARCEADPAAFPPPPPPPARDPDAPPLPPPLPELGAVPPPTERPAAASDVETAFWAYDASFSSANPSAPPVPAELVAAARDGADVAVRRIDADGGERPGGFEALVRMAWTEGPSAFVLVRRTGRRLEGNPLELLLPGLLVGAGVLIAVLLASGPVVRRIRRLEVDVRRSAAAHYDTSVSVEGRDEVADLARAFDEAAAEVRAHVAAVERREGALREFVADTTHDVMTPLTVLAGHLDALRPVIESADDEARTALRSALAEVDYTTSLVANLTTAAKLVAGGRALVRHRLDLCALVERVASRHRPLANARDVDLNHATPRGSLDVDGDVTLLEQAVGNIVQNAVRYNRPGGHVAVVLRAARGRFEIRVEDDGPGLAQDDLAHLTERGFRGTAARTRARTRAESGRGLGLDITAEVCERLGFDLAFQPVAEGGLAVVITGAVA